MSYVIKAISIEIETSQVWFQLEAKLVELEMALD